MSENSKSSHKFNSSPTKNTSEFFFFWTTYSYLQIELGNIQKYAQISKACQTSKMGLFNIIVNNNVICLIGLWIPLCFACKCVCDNKIKPNLLYLLYPINWDKVWNLVNDLYMQVGQWSLSVKFLKMFKTLRFRTYWARLWQTYVRIWQTYR